MCPNCYHYLKARLDIPLKTIYQKLIEMGLGNEIAGKRVLFPPCPDRENEEMLSDIRCFLEEEPKILKNVQCCGLGGCAGGKEPKLAADMPEGLAIEEVFYTYCASCSGSLARKGYQNMKHILPDILGLQEQPDTKSSLFNRMKAGWWKI